MYCSHCGAVNAAEAFRCQACGTDLTSAPARVSATPYVPNYLVWAILVTVLCCLPFGIVSIVYAAQVNTLLATGNLPAAIEASRQARRWAIVGACCWLVLIVIYMIFMGLIVGLGLVGSAAHR